MVRPTKELTAGQKVEVETLAALLSQDQIADYFGIVRNTFRAICARDPEVNERYKRGKAKAIAHVAQGLLMKARNGDTTSSIFYLKTQGGWRETDRHEHAMAVNVGNRFPVESLTDAELEACLAEVVAVIREEHGHDLLEQQAIDLTPGTARR
jgi:hypothetical protein